MEITKLCLIICYFITNISCKHFYFQPNIGEEICIRKHNILQCHTTHTPADTININNYSVLSKDIGENVVAFLNETKVRREYKRLQLVLIHKLKAQQILKNQSESGSESIIYNQNEDIPSIGNQGYRRIISGFNTSISSIPWQVSIRENQLPYCGGTIVTRNWILTAAHCGLRKKPKNISVRIGSTWKSKGGSLHQISNILVHPNYNEHTKSHDVGLMSISTRLLFSDNIMPLRIITRNAIIPANLGAVVSGYGKLWESGSAATRLQATYVETVAMKLCKRAGFAQFEIYPETMFCAGSFTPKWPDACQGDSGGPIFAEGALVGIVSWGLGCARGNFPGVYTRLSHPSIYDWIHGYIATPEKDNDINNFR